MEMGRGDAAAATWIVRGDGVAATPRLRRGSSAGTESRPATRTESAETRKRPRYEMKRHEVHERVAPPLPGDDLFDDALEQFLFLSADNNGDRPGP